MIRLCWLFPTWEPDLSDPVMNTVIHPLADGSLEFTDSLLYYPKDGFIDSEGAIWLGGLNSVYRIENNKLRRYHPGKQFWSDSFVESWSFTESSGGELWMASWRGYLFRYDRNEDRLEQVHFTDEGSIRINSLKFFNGELFAATSGE